VCYNVANLEANRAGVMAHLPAIIAVLRRHVGSPGVVGQGYGVASALWNLIDEGTAMGALLPLAAQALTLHVEVEGTSTCLHRVCNFLYNLSLRDSMLQPFVTTGVARPVVAVFRRHSNDVKLVQYTARVLSKLYSLASLPASSRVLVLVQLPVLVQCTVEFQDVDLTSAPLLALLNTVGSDVPDGPLPEEALHCVPSLLSALHHLTHRPAVARGLLRVLQRMAPELDDVAPARAGLGELVHRVKRSGRRMADVLTLTEDVDHALAVRLVSDRSTGFIALLPLLWDPTSPWPTTYMRLMTHARRTWPALVQLLALT
jgi:hypothetical protein